MGEKSSNQDMGELEFVMIKLDITYHLCNKYITWISPSYLNILTDNVAISSALYCSFPQIVTFTHQMNCLNDCAI